MVATSDGMADEHDPVLSWGSVKAALRRWRARPDFWISVWTIYLLGAFIGVARETIVNNRPPDYFWMFWVGLAIACAVWLALRFKRVRAHAESIPVVLVVFSVATGAALDLGDDVNNIGIPMLTGLIGVGLASWFAHRTVIMDRLDRERKFDEDSRRTTEVLTGQLAELQAMVRVFGEAWTDERIARSKERAGLDRAWVDLAKMHMRTSGIVSNVTAQQADIAEVRQRGLVAAIGGRGRVRPTAGHRSRIRAVRRARVEWLRDHPIITE